MGQYVMAEEFMENANKTGYEKYNRLAKHMYDIINTGINMSKDKNFILLTHSDEENGVMKIKTIGKLLDDKIVLAGLFTYVFYTATKMSANGPEYRFATNRAQDDRFVQLPAKTPIGVFDELYIPNDLGLVLQKIEEFENSED